jgi:DNA (cytosine-5)-methyltransferase 1
MAGKRLGKEDDRHLWPEMLRTIREIRPTWVVGENVLGLVNWNGGLVFDEVQADLEAEGYQVQSYVLPAVSVNAPHRRDRVWLVAYSNYPRADIGMRTERERQTEDNGRERQPFIKYWENGSDGDVANATGERRKEWKQNWGLQNTEEDRAKMVVWPERFGFNENVADTMRPRGEQNNRERESEFIDKDGKGANWENFPTQSPLCGGDDGLPTELDGITFSSWRNKSIMGYGNAVVPQVVLQIFKAIELYEQQRTDQMGDMDAPERRMHGMEE